MKKSKNWSHGRFILIDVGKEGRRSDVGVFSSSEIKSKLDANTLNIPEPSMVGQYELPFVFFGHEAYPLSHYLMRPYPKSSNLNLRKKVNNYRQSRARRIVESAFGILASRWRIFRRRINTYVSKAERMVLATVWLHNFIITRELEKRPQERRYLCYNETDNSQLSLGMRNIEGVRKDNTHKKLANEYRERFTDYFMGEGAIEWQWHKAANNEF